MAFEHLFSPTRLGPLELRNRTMMTTHGPRLGPGRYLAYLEERSHDVALVGVSAGAGISSVSFAPGALVESYLGEADAVLPDPLTSEGIAFYDRAIPRLREQADIVHRHGGLIVGQVLHTGISRHEDNLQPAIGPSDVRDELRRHSPHVLAVDEIEQLVAAFGHAGRRVREAGMDGVEIHAAHGYLVNEFLSPRTNHRTDRYGGSPEARLRFLVEIVAAIGARAGDDFPIGVRIPGTELVDDGLSVDDVCAIGAELAQLGIAYLNVSSGNYSGLRSGLRLAYVAPSSVPEGPNVGPAGVIRRTVGLPVIVSGRLTDMATAERILADGDADVIGFTRALIADPQIIRKAGRDDLGPPNRCIACNECHLGPGKPMSCAVNPVAGREEELGLGVADQPRHVVVVGAGPAGAQCALAAAGRGHRVTLLERQDRVGGLLGVLAVNPHQALLGRFVTYLEEQLARSPVDVRLGVEATPAVLAELGPDVTVLATGAAERVPPIEGVDAGHVHTALDAYRGLADPGRRVVVVGGLEDHLAPLRLAQWLATGDRQVVVFTELVAPGEGIEPATRLALLRDLIERRVAVVPLARVTAIDGPAIEVENVLTNDRQIHGDFDTVLLCCGGSAASPLAAAVGPEAGEVRLVGDCLAPRRLVHATLDGARLAATI